MTSVGDRVRVDGDAVAYAVETHASWVFFAGDRVVKVKKPVRFPFVDLSTREARERICRREVELNRPYAPDVYLGVLTISDDTGPVDHAVLMRRLPDERRLASMIQRREPVDDHLRRLAHDIAWHHSVAPATTRAAHCASRVVVRCRWIDNLDAFRGVERRIADPAVLARIGHLAARYLDGRGPLFSRRVIAGKAREGHGDLLADDIFCLDDGPRILDCLEFDDDLRAGDVLADVAFLAMDLERLGGAQPADRFLAWYREYAGETFPASLADHYIAYRAVIRAKVALLRAGQGATVAYRDAERFLRQALHRLERGRVRLVLVGGAPGTGKTTVAEGVANARGWIVLRSDEVRKELAGLPHDAPANAGLDAGVYDTAWTERTYGEMLARARKLLAMGESVVLDATWPTRALRSRAAAAARETASDLVAIRCLADRARCDDRILARRGKPGVTSDVTPAIAASIERRFEAWPQAIELDTTGLEDAAVDTALEALEAAG